MPATICASRAFCSAGSTQRCTTSRWKKNHAPWRADDVGRSRAAGPSHLTFYSAPSSCLRSWTRRPSFSSSSRSTYARRSCAWSELLQRDDGAREDLANLAKNILGCDAELAMCCRALEQRLGSFLI